MPNYSFILILGLISAGVISCVNIKLKADRDIAESKRNSILFAQQAHQFELEDQADTAKQQKELAEQNAILERKAQLADEKLSRDCTLDYEQQQAEQVQQQSTETQPTQSGMLPPPMSLANAPVDSSQGFNGRQYNGDNSGTVTIESANGPYQESQSEWNQQLQAQDQARNDYNQSQTNLDHQLGYDNQNDAPPGLTPP